MLKKEYRVTVPLCQQTAGLPEIQRMNYEYAKKAAEHFDIAYLFLGLLFLLQSSALAYFRLAGAFTSSTMLTGAGPEYG